jgi:hypothetical protein
MEKRYFYVLFVVLIGYLAAWFINFQDNQELREVNSKLIVENTKLNQEIIELEENNLRYLLMLNYQRGNCEATMNENTTQNAT